MRIDTKCEVEIDLRQDLQRSAQRYLASAKHGCADIEIDDAVKLDTGDFNVVQNVGRAIRISVGVEVKSDVISDRVQGLQCRFEGRWI